MLKFPVAVAEQGGGSFAGDSLSVFDLGREVKDYQVLGVPAELVTAAVGSRLCRRSRDGAGLRRAIL